PGIGLGNQQGVGGADPWRGGPWVKRREQAGGTQGEDVPGGRTIGRGPRRGRTQGPEGHSQAGQGNPAGRSFTRVSGRARHACLGCGAGRSSIAEAYPEVVERSSDYNEDPIGNVCEISRQLRCNAELYGGATGCSMQHDSINE